MITTRSLSFSLLNLLGIVLIFSSCDSRRVYEQNTELPDYVWNKNNVLKFDINIQDTINSHNLFINVRNASGYPYSNLFLFVTTHSPKGGVVKDTVELTLADAKGKWLGSGLGDIWDNQIPYKMNVKFPFKGIYKIELVQAMRKDKLSDIMDAGIRIERVK